MSKQPIGGSEGAGPAAPPATPNPAPGPTVGPPPALPPLRIPGITPPDGAFSNLFNGEESIDDQMAHLGLRIGTPQADQWLLNQAGNPADAHFTNLRTDAQKRQSLRAQFPNTTPEEELAIEAGHTPNPRTFQNLEPNEKNAVGAANQAEAKRIAAANAKGAFEDATRGKPVGSVPLIVDSNGNPVSGAPGAPTGPSNQSGAIAGNTGSGVKPNLVWLATGPNQQELTTFAKDAKGNYIQNPDGSFQKVTPQGNLVHGTDIYMSVDDAKQSIYGMDPKQVMAIQKAYHINPSGVVDAKTFTLWGEAVDAAAGYTKAGRHISPIDVLTTGVKAGRGSGGGGGGGGGGAAKFKRSDVQALLTNVTQKELGRDPSEAEVSAFLSYFDGLAGSDTADPTQIATNWVRLRNGAEAGSYGAATNYYQAMLAVLGPSAAGGAG